MICDSCKKERIATDFINNQIFCYRCVYREKQLLNTEKRTEKSLFCRTCDAPIVFKENFKKRQRTIFCSHECAEKGHKEQLINHWTRRVCSSNPYHHTGVNIWNISQA